MAKEARYRQCRLERVNDAGDTITTTTWLPERHKGTAIEPGVRVSLREHVSGKDVEGVWEVMTVSENSQDGAKAHARAHMWTRYRAATDS